MIAERLNPKVDSMPTNNPNCLGHYDFDRIVLFARKRFVEGCDTVTLLKMAKSDLEKEEIILISLLDIEDDRIKDIQFQCKYATQCEVTNCRAILKKMFEQRVLPDTENPFSDSEMLNLSQQ